MKTLPSYVLLGLGCCAITLYAISGDQADTSSATPTPRPRIGVYDSRAVAVAYCGTARHEAEIKRLDIALERAKASKQPDEIQRAEAAVWDARKRLHRQGFGTHPVDDILEQIPDEIARIQKELRLIALVSRWDKKALAKYEDAEIVDVNERLIDALQPGERQRRYTREIQEKKPIPSAALELMLLKEAL